MTRKSDYLPYGGSRKMNVNTRTEWHQGTCKVCREVKYLHDSTNKCIVCEIENKRAPRKKKIVKEDDKK